VEAEAKLGTDRNLPIWYFNFLQYEAPQHQVTLTKPCGIGTYEVTRGQFRKFFDETGYKTDAEKNGEGGEGFRNGQVVKMPELNWNSDLGFEPPETDNSPVVNVTCNDGMEFCKWLSKKEGVTYRLPTEAEWAFACRGGNPRRYCFGDDDAMLKHYAWVLDGNRRGASEGGFKLANAFGLFDMHGNVWEWCQDWHGTYPSHAVIDPTGPESGEYRVSRGGPWGGSPEICRTAYRSWGINGAYSTGFRVVRTLTTADDDTQAGERNK